MLRITTGADSAAPPEQVLAAARDFSERRPQIWPNVKQGHFEVHAVGETYAEATEELWPVGFWERCRYDWSQPGRVKATVVDSNVLAPGSSWELTVSPIDGGSRVEATFLRDFRRSARGRLAKAVNRLAGRPLLGWDLRRALAAIEVATRASSGRR